MIKPLKRLQGWHEAAILDRLEGMTYAEIAEKHGKSESHISHLFIDPLFSSRYESLKNDVRNGVMDALIGSGIEAAKTIAGKLKSKDDRIALDAAKDIVNRISGKPTERQKLEVTGKDGGPIETKEIGLLELISVLEELDLSEDKLDELEKLIEIEAEGE